MSWLRKRQLTEARLWDHLDACAIPFREPVRYWSDHGHLTPSVWCEGLDYSIPDVAAPFVPKLDSPMRAQIDATTDMDAPPDRLWGAVQGAGNFQLNYAHAIAALTALFGKGAENSSRHAVSRVWQFGHARLSCTVFPPEAQTAPAPPRHALFPQTAQEAKIAIFPAWRVPADADICAQARLLWEDPVPKNRPLLTAFSQDWPAALPALPQGIAAAPDGTLLAIKPGGIVDIMPRGKLTGLVLSPVPAARGGAGRALSAVYQSATRDGAAESRREIAQEAGSRGALDGLAQTLAARLELPLQIPTSGDA